MVLPEPTTRSRRPTSAWSARGPSLRSPDGSQLAFYEQYGAVILLDLESGDRRTVVAPPVDADALLTELRAITDLAWSSDGALLAVESRSINVDAYSGGVDVEVVPISGGPAIVVRATEDLAPVAMAALLADGSLLVGVGIQSDPDDPRLVAGGLGRVDLGSGSVTDLTEGTLDGLDATPDGSWLLASDDGMLTVVPTASGVGRAEPLPTPPPGVLAAAW